MQKTLWQKSSRPFVSILALLGVDSAVLSVLAGRASAFAANAITAALLVVYVTPAEQGYYFTFLSVLGLRVFFDMSFSFVLLQCASHEMAHLRWAAGGVVIGDPRAKARLSGLWRGALRWYSVASVAFIAVLLTAGTVFFGHYQSRGGAVNWRTAWVAVALLAGGNLLVAPALALLEGCGLVALVGRVRFVEVVLGSLALWFGLHSRLGLLAMPVGQSAGLAWTVLWVITTRRKYFLDLLDPRWSGCELHWRAEVWPFQWRMALSSMSGFLIFQLFNPVLFMFRGAAEAGRMGLTVSAFNAILWTSMIWLTTKAPAFGMLIAKREYGKLDRLFARAVAHSLVPLLTGLTAFVGVVYWLNRQGHPFAQRVLNPLPVVFLALATLIQYIIYAEATYLRAHKKEPFLFLSMGGAALMALSTVVLGRSFGAAGIVLGNLAIGSLYGLGPSTWVFFARRREWHSDAHIDFPADPLVVCSSDD